MGIDEKDFNEMLAKTTELFKDFNVEFMQLLSKWDKFKEFFWTVREKKSGVYYADFINDILEEVDGNLFQFLMKVNAFKEAFSAFPEKMREPQGGNK